MTNNEILKADLLDILFEHRNKMYGAYTLRRYYNSRLLIALGIALSAVFLFFLISFIKGEAKHTESFRGDNNNEIRLTQVKIEPPEDPAPPKPKKAASIQQVKDVTIKIVPDDKADDVIPDQKQIEESAISDQTVKGETPEDPNKGVTNAPAETGKGQEEQPKEIFDPVEVQPSFPGGPAALALFFSRNINPPDNLEPGEKKIVMVRFVVGADGSITQTEIIQSSGEIYEKEVLRAFKRMPKWNPAIQNGHKIAVAFTQPVTFIGQEEEN